MLSVFLAPVYEATVLMEWFSWMLLEKQNTAKSTMTSKLNYNTEMAHETWTFNNC